MLQPTSHGLLFIFFGHINDFVRYDYYLASNGVDAAFVRHLPHGGVQEGAYRRCPEERSLRQNEGCRFQLGVQGQTGLSKNRQK